MARIPMVTRTINNTVCNLLVADTEMGELKNISVTVPRTYKDEKKLAKVAFAAAETDTVKPVQLISSQIEGVLYGMSEEDFIKHAQPIEHRTAATSEENA